MNDVDTGMESLLEAFIYETNEMLDQLDEILLESEKEKTISENNINSIFRITHTIKGSAAMLEFDEMSTLAHAVEDVFYIIREDISKLDIVFDELFDLVFQSSDFLRKEITAVQAGNYTPSDASALISSFHNLAAVMKGEEAAAQQVAENAPQQEQPAVVEEQPAPVATGGHEAGDVLRVRVFFQDGCQMENMRSFMLISQLKGCCGTVESIPDHPERDAATSAEIVKNGLVVCCSGFDSEDDVIKVIEQALNIKSYEVISEGELSAEQPQQEVPASTTPAIPQPEKVEEKPAVQAEPVAPQPKAKQATVETSKPAASAQPAASAAANANANAAKAGVKQSLISVNQSKLDHLMDLVGEIVTAESMVVRDPDLEGLRLDHFTKSVRELRKLTDELQDVVMSIRMLPLHGTFQKMSRIVRDMAKKLGKQAELVTYGGDTEIDKTINDAIADPLMHMIRNSMDHAIELPEERVAMGKPAMGKVMLSARNVGGEILLDVSDDGCGLDPKKLLAKAREKGLLVKPESEYTDKEAYQLIMLAGFSTNQEVTEYSGRGVGMDVVRKNIEKVGGSIVIHSELGKGTTFSIKIPLTLAIVDGMNLSVGDTVLTLPITSIKQSFKVTDPEQIIRNSNGSEMIMVRGECLPILRLHEMYQIEPKCTNITDGILIQIENSSANACIFADELLGEYQVVVKPFPKFFNKYDLKSQGLSGCSILGDGTVSLILDANALINNL